MRKDKSHLNLCDVYLWWFDTYAHRWLNLMCRSLEFCFLSSFDSSSFLDQVGISHTCQGSEDILKTKTVFLYFCILRCLCISSFYIQDLLLTIVPPPKKQLLWVPEMTESSLFWKMPIADKRWSFRGVLPQSSWCWVNWFKHLML